MHIMRRIEETGVVKENDFTGDRSIFLPVEKEESAG